MPLQPLAGILKCCFLLSLFNTHIVIKNFLYSSGAAEESELSLIHI